MHTYACKHEGMPESPSTTETYADVCALFSALSAPVRAAIVHRLTERDWTVGDLAEQLDVSQPLVSQHLRVLRSARLVVPARTGRTTTYHLVDDHVAHVFLDALKHTEESHR